MTRNTTGQKLTVFAFDRTTNAPKTGDAANITAYVSIDNGTLTALTDTSATEISSTNAAGYYLFDLSQAETNGDKLTFTAKSATSNIVVVAVPAVAFTRPANFSTLALTASQSVGTSTYGGGDTSGVTTLLTRIGGNLTISGGKVAATIATGDIADISATRAGYIDTIKNAVAGLVDLLGGWQPVEETDLETSETVATAVRTELTTELGRIDVAVSTLATATQATNISSALSLKATSAQAVEIIDALTPIAADAANANAAAQDIQNNVNGIVSGGLKVTLAATQPAYAPAKASDIPSASDNSTAVTTSTAFTDLASDTAAAREAAVAVDERLPDEPASKADVQSGDDPAPHIDVRGDRVGGQIP